MDLRGDTDMNNTKAVLASWWDRFTGVRPPPDPHADVRQPHEQPGTWGISFSIDTVPGGRGDQANLTVRVRRGAYSSKILGVPVHLKETHKVIYTMEDKYREFVSIYNRDNDADDGPGLRLVKGSMAYVMAKLTKRVAGV